MGSSRVIAQSNGTLCYDADFTPYGGERSYTSTCAQNYKFEGKERDTETQNDDFGAREYSWRFGRWLSADWSSVPVPVPYANLSNPQTLNLYAMVADDPESFADLDGHDTCNGPNNNCFPPNTHTVFDNINRIATPPQELAASQKTAAQNASQVAQNRQPDGSYKATPSQIAEIKEKAKNKERITTSADPLGQCVTACEHFTGVPGPTSSWRKGKAATDLTDKDMGTAIGTFVGSGEKARYKSDQGGHKNTGTYMGQSVGGFWMADQWPGAKPVSIWFVPTHDPNNPDNASMNGSSYSVILVPKP